jgi:hypothetical protein
MSDNNYLPQMTMPPPEPEKPIEEPDADPLVSKADGKEGSVKLEIEDRDEETGEENPNFIYSDEDEEAEPPPVLKRPKLKNEDIFRTPKVMAIAEPVKEKKKRKPPSQKQLDALAKARENMKLKREEAKKLKEEGKDVPKSKRQVNQEKQVKEVIQQQGQIYTQEEISKIVEQGIQKYDIQRKARKAVKQEQKQKDDQEAKVRQTLNRALGQPDPNDIWSHALSGMYGGV